ncbi:MAG: sigma-E processing peptidase SpoIIGA [Clostridia bacterium]|nr:sigma-E processing peptidase SpoIIGA [Clostridia bacterium]
MVREVFIDQWLAGAMMSWLMNTLLLWTTGRIIKKPVPWWRLVGAGFVGGLYHFGFCYRWELGRVGKGEIVFFAATGFLLLLLAFLPLTPKKLAKTAGIFFLLAILTAGLTSAIYYLSWYSWGFSPGGGGILLINLFALFFLGELGWGLLHRLVWERSCLIPIRLSFGEKTKEMVALLDTGNLLVDPLTKTPVVLVEATALTDILPERIARLSSAVFAGDFSFSSGWDLEGGWAKRVRLLSFTGVGEKKGFMLGLRPDELLIRAHARGEERKRLWYPLKNDVLIRAHARGEEPRRVLQVLVGLYHPPAAGGACTHLYQALLPASLLAAE